MFRDGNEITDAFRCAMDLARNERDMVGLIGYGTVVLLDGDMRVKEIEPFVNRITTTGDAYYARRGAAGIGTPNLAQPTLVNGMKLGTGSTAAAKSGVNAALGTYEATSNQLFDTTHPALTDLAGDTGWDIVYKCTWGAGDVTEAALTEAVIVNDAAVDATSTEANTIARIVYASKNKTADDTLAITWAHTFNGA